ncbi:MAG: DUF3089 domain-containing protein [Lachnospiraceae bacterium]|nr:DUF3089 domain-containing protein [Lachnospiraceae bacterium]
MKKHEKNHKKKRTVSLFLAALLAIGALTSCGSSSKDSAQDDSEITSEVDYSQEDNWAYYASAEGETKADVFFVCPTVYSGADDACNMDIQDDDVRGSFLGATNMEKGIYDEETRFFAPYYSQAGLNVYEMDEEEEMEPYLDIAYADVKNAFLYYLEEENDGNPIILAGFSQGGDMCIRLLEDCFADEEVQDLLVACYAIGWRITEEDMEEYPYLTFAEDADDTGVIIAFDAEDPEIEDSIIIPEGTKSLCINPLSWSTDTAVADRSLNLGACFTNYDGEIVTEIPEFTGAYIDEERGALKVTDVSPEEYPSNLPIFEDGSYHTYDYEFFYRNLQENVQTRIDAYLD